MEANLGEAQCSRLYCLLRADRLANRKRGCSVERRQRSLSGYALKGLKPRERTWLKGYQGARRGSKASRRMVSART